MFRNPPLLCADCAERRIAAEGGELARTPLLADCATCGRLCGEWSYLVARDRRHMRKLDRWVRGQQLAGIAGETARFTLKLVLALVLGGSLLLGLLLLLAG